jgi:hypothetical protein
LNKIISAYNKIDSGLNKIVEGRRRVFVARKEVEHVLPSPIVTGCLWWRRALMFTAGLRAPRISDAGSCDRG